LKGNTVVLLKPCKDLVFISLATEKNYRDLPWFFAAGCSCVWWPAGVFFEKHEVLSGCPRSIAARAPWLA